MSNPMHGGTRTKNAREAYVEQLPYGHGLTPYMNKKRKTISQLNPSYDTDFGYLSTPEYLRQVLQQTSIIPSPSPIEMLAANVPRTKSASELTPRNNLNRSTSGNPKYKAQEDYYDDIQSLKKEMKTIKDENSNLRAKIRRLEEDNTRKRKEIDTLYEPTKDGDLRRTLSGSTTDRTNNIPVSNVVMSLKQRVFKLESQLKQKETAIDEMKSDPKWTKSTELEIQNRALFGEVERQKVERLNYIQHNDYAATVDEEKKNAVRKLDREKKELTTENESLKKRIHELENGKHDESLSARPRSDHNEKEPNRKIDDLKQECQTYKNDIEQTKKTLQKTERERDKFQEKLDQANESLEEIKRDRDQYHKKFDQANENLTDIKRERDEYRKKFDQAKEDLEKLKPEHDQKTKSNKPDRSSPIPKHYEDEKRDSVNTSSTRVQRPQSPTPDKGSPRSSTTAVHRNSHSPEEPTKNESKTSAPIRNSNDQIGPRTSAFKLDRPSSSPLINATKPSETSSPKPNARVDNLGSDIVRSRPTSAGTTNESALKLVQASLRGYLQRNEIDNTGRGGAPSPPPRPRTPTPVKKSLPIDSDDDDTVESTSLQSASQYGNANKRASVPDQSKSSSTKKDLPNSKQSIQNDKTGSNNPLSANNRDSANRTNRPSSPTAVRPRPSSPQFGSSSGSKQTVPTDRNKLGSGSRLPKDDQTSASKARRTPSPPSDSNRSSPPPIAKSGGSKETLLNDRNKLGSGSRLPKDDQTSASKARRTPSPPPDNQRSSSPPIAKSGSSKQALPNDQNKLGSANKFPPSNRDSLSKPHRSPSPPTDAHRPTSPQVGSGGGSKQSLPNDRTKLGSGSRFPTNDRESSSKLQRPSSPPDVRRPTSPENSRPPSRKSPTNSKQALNNIQEADDDDDVSAS